MTELSLRVFVSLVRWHLVVVLVFACFILAGCVLIEAIFGVAELSASAADRGNLDEAVFVEAGGGELHRANDSASRLFEGALGLCWLQRNRSFVEHAQRGVLHCLTLNDRLLELCLHIELRRAQGLKAIGSSRECIQDHGRVAHLGLTMGGGGRLLEPAASVEGPCTAAFCLMRVAAQRSFEHAHF